MANVWAVTCQRKVYFETCITVCVSTCVTLNRPLTIVMVLVRRKKMVFKSMFWGLRDFSPFPHKLAVKIAVARDTADGMGSGYEQNILFHSHSRQVETQQDAEQSDS